VYRLSSPFQNRLVGTIIVAAAAIIFLPDILNGEKRSHNDRFEAMPVAPAANNMVPIKKFPANKLSRLAKETISNDVALDEQLFSETKTEAPKAVALTPKTLKPSIVKVSTLQKNATIKSAQAKKSSVKTPSKKAKTNSSKTSKSKARGKTLPEVANNAWVIQLGSFREQHNVNSLIRKLQKNGYSAFSKPIKTRHGNLIKVFVGPDLSKTLLTTKLAKLKKLTNMQGKIARFKPAN
jgi:DedD protein